MCDNARDAIVGTGRLIIETENTAVDERYVANHPEMASGAYVRMTVADNGNGMSKVTMENIFEPFFTTKEQGKGNGLGLATVYGIMQQNNGPIWVYSELKIGTTFVNHLPRVADELPGALPDVAAELPRGNGETAPVVEDELLVLKMGIEILEQLGYRVIPADSPGAALAALAANPGPVDLPITDVIMPETNGSELAVRIAAVRPAIKRLFMSGYPADFIAHRGVLEAGVDFLQKPFSLSDLAFKVRAALGDRTGP